MTLIGNNICEVTLIGNNILHHRRARAKWRIKSQVESRQFGRQTTSLGKTNTMNNRGTPKATKKNNAMLPDNSGHEIEIAGILRSNNRKKFKNIK